MRDTLVEGVMCHCLRIGEGVYISEVVPQT